MHKKALPRIVNRIQVLLENFGYTAMTEKDLQTQILTSFELGLFYSEMARPQPLRQN